MATKKLRYIGPYRPGVDIEIEPGRFETVEHNHMVEVESDLADRLLQQEENWSLYYNTRDGAAPKRDDDKEE